MAQLSTLEQHRRKTQEYANIVKREQVIIECGLNLYSSLSWDLITQHPYERKIVEIIYPKLNH